MRYKCNICEQWIKDKFIFGLYHFCLSEEEYKFKAVSRQLMENQHNIGLFSNINVFFEELRRGQK